MANAATDSCSHSGKRRCWRPLKLRGRRHLDQHPDDEVVELVEVEVDVIDAAVAARHC